MFLWAVIFSVFQCLCSVHGADFSSMERSTWAVRGAEHVYLYSSQNIAQKSVYWVNAVSEADQLLRTLQENFRTQLAFTVQFLCSLLSKIRPLNALLTSDPLCSSDPGLISTTTTKKQPQTAGNTASYWTLNVAQYFLIRFMLECKCVSRWWRWKISSRATHSTVCTCAMETRARFIFSFVWPAFVMMCCHVVNLRVYLSLRDTSWLAGI